MCTSDHSGTDTVITLDNISGVEIPLQHSDIETLVSLIEHHEQRSFSLLEFVFTDSTEIQRINKKFLQHNYVTDVITFPYHDEDTDGIEATVYGCAQQIIKQSDIYGTSQYDEFSRIVIHALLHLVGYDDTDEPSRNNMQEREQFYLNKQNR